MPRVPQASPARAKRDGYARGPRFEGGRTVHYSAGSEPPGRATSVDQPLLHTADRDPPQHRGEGEQRGEADQVDRLEAEGGAADQLDQLVQGVEPVSYT